MFHPIIAGLSCAECQRYHINHNWMTGRPIDASVPHGGRQQRHGQDWERDGQPAPCQERPDEARPICPKGSPEKEAQHQLTAKNRRVWELFLALQAGATMTREEASNPLLRRKLAILARYWEQHRQDATAEALAHSVASSIARLL